MIKETLGMERLRSMSPDDAAALLAVRRSGGGAGGDDALAAWLRLDEANARAWQRTQKAWLAFDDAEDDEILQAMRRGARRTGPLAAPWRPRLAAAGVALLLLTGTFFLALRGGDAPDHALKSGVPAAQVAGGAPRLAGVLSYASAKGLPSVFNLSDGSRLTLDTDSAVETDFTAGRRDLRLVRGRAFFDVKHDAQRPFIVHAAGREVVALGTRFGVRLYSESVRVVLVEGTVSVKTPDDRSSGAVLKAGEQLISRPGAAPVVSAANVEEALNWQRGFLTFDNDTLAVVATELNRYSPDEITIADPKVARLRVTGMFRAGDPMRFGNTLAEVYAVRMKRTAPHQLEIVAAK